MATLSTLREQVKAMYGLAYTTTEDPKFTNTILDMAINGAHRRVAEQTYCYRQRQVLDVPAMAHGVSSVPLDCSVIRIDDFSVQVLANGAWVVVELRSEPEVFNPRVPAPEAVSAGTPVIAYLRRGEALDAQLVLDLVPGFASAVTGGLAVQAYVWPALLAGDDDTPAIPPALHDRLAKMAVYELCKLDQASGRQDAALGVWAREAEAALLEIREVIRRQTSGNIRRVGRDPRDPWFY